MKKLVIFCLSLSLFCSCKKDEKVAISDQEIQDKNIPLQEITPTLETDFLKLRNTSELISILQAKNIDERDKVLKAFEDIKGFTSFREKNDVSEKQTIDSSILKLRNTVNNSELSLKQESDEKLPSLIESIVNEKGLVMLGNSLFQFTTEYVKELKNYTGQPDLINRLKNSNKTDIESGIYINKIEKRTLQSFSKNLRVGPYSEYIQGGALYIPFYGSMYVRGYLTCTNVPIGSTNNWIIQAESRAYSDANSELTNAETYMEVTSSTHPGSLGTSGKTRLKYVIGTSTTNVNFIGQVKFVLVMYPFGYKKYSVGYINISN
ncbi:hypothetical protein [Dyadobacter sp. CY356]|uniref:hypothetical protein n=1 Tax=Dyadobacter sp. CY356 TaxID=2906442 RepID=UPI001F2E1BD7|nr:hypothetical protein [Dyadobacter sp. CY356]MCF0056677.1 hypothetical protein [Dyadobacter sp. CY356]